MIKLANDLKLPLEVAGQAIALVGIRGSGKTNTAGVITEELLDRRTHPVLVIDPTDGSWGLRSGYPVFIFGGPHGDLPLNETDGKVIAEFIVTEQVPLICSIRHLRKAAQRRFVTELFEELYHLKGKPENRFPLTVILDESPLFVPQKVMGEVARTVGAVEDLIARGRNTGFGVVLIGQRPATINKDVLSQADTIITHRITSPHDRKALSDWIEENASIEKQKEVLSSLATLKDGEAWVWAPMFDIFKRVQIRRRRTFDSSATPKMGEKVRTPKDLTSIDLDKLKGKLAATIEKAKADDPRELRKRIAELERDLKASTKISLPTERQATSTKPALTDAERELLKGLGSDFREFVDAIADRADVMLNSIAARAKAEIDKACAEWVGGVDKRRALFLEHLEKTRLQKVLEKIANATPQTAVHTSGLHQRVAVARGPSERGGRLPVVGTVRAQVPQDRRDAGVRGRAPATGTAEGNGYLPPGEKATLIAAAQYADGITREQASILTGYKRSSRDAYIQRLIGKGYVEIARTGNILATQAGIDALGSDYEPLPTGEALQEYWLQRLPPGERAVLEQAISHYPNSVDRDILSETTGYKRSSRDAYIQRLMARQLLEKGGGPVTATAVLFEN